MRSKSNADHIQLALLNLELRARLEHTTVRMRVLLAHGNTRFEDPRRYLCLARAWKTCEIVGFNVT